MSGQVVCILHQNVQNTANLSTNKLVLAGCKLRSSANIVPDLIMSRSGTTAAFILVVNPSDLHKDSNTWNRAEKISKTFKHSFMLATATASAYVVQAACRYLSSLPIICFPPGTDLFTKAVEFFGALATPENELACQVCPSTWMHNQRATSQLDSKITGNGHRPLTLPVPLITPAKSESIARTYKQVQRAA